jgi:hypothetical protein
VVNSCKCSTEHAGAEEIGDNSGHTVWSSCHFPEIFDCSRHCAMAFCILFRSSFCLKVL